MQESIIWYVCIGSRTTVHAVIGRQVLETACGFDLVVRPYGEVIDFPTTCATCAKALRARNAKGVE